MFCGCRTWQEQRVTIHQLFTAQLPTLPRHRFPTLIDVVLTGYFQQFTLFTHLQKIYKVLWYHFYFSDICRLKRTYHNILSNYLTWQKIRLTTQKVCWITVSGYSACFSAISAGTYRKILTGTLGSTAAFAKFVDSIEQERTVSVRPSL